MITRVDAVLIGKNCPASYTSIDSLAAGDVALFDKNKVLISPEAIVPIQNLKTEYLGSVNPRLHSNEILIALSVSALHSEDAKKALAMLPKLKGMQAHVTCDVADVDLSIYANLGIMLTYDANKK